MDNVENTNAKVPDAEPVFINNALADLNNSSATMPLVLTVPADEELKPSATMPLVHTVPNDVSLANGINLLRPIAKAVVSETLTKEELQKATESFFEMDDNDKENEDIYAGDKRIDDDDDSQDVKQNEENVTSETEKTPDLEQSVNTETDEDTGDNEARRQKIGNEYSIPVNKQRSYILSSKPEEEKTIEDVVLENCNNLEKSFEKLTEKHPQLQGFLSLVKTHLADLKNRCTGLK